MPAVFRNARLLLTTSATAAYTCPAGTTAIFLLAQIGNVDPSNPVDVTSDWTDSSASNAVTTLLPGYALAPKAAVNALLGKLVLEAGDTFRGRASANGDAELTLSVLELS